MHQNISFCCQHYLEICIGENNIWGMAYKSINYQTLLQDVEKIVQKVADFWKKFRDWWAAIMACMPMYLILGAI